MTEPAKPVDSAEIYGTESRPRNTYEYPAGPEVHVGKIDGESSRSSVYTKPRFVSPGLHRIELAVVELYVEAKTEIDFWAEANHRYEIFAAYHGQAEFNLYCRDITNSPAKDVFAATVQRSVFLPKVRYFFGPVVPASEKKQPNQALVPTPASVTRMALR